MEERNGLPQVLLSQEFTITACRRGVSADLAKDIFSAAVLRIDRQIGSPRLSGSGALVSQGYSVHMKPGNDETKNGNPVN
jgi:hypothetical protein